MTPGGEIQWDVHSFQGHNLYLPNGTEPGDIGTILCGLVDAPDEYNIPIATTGSRSRLYETRLGLARQELLWLNGFEPLSWPRVNIMFQYALKQNGLLNGPSANLIKGLNVRTPEYLGVLCATDFCDEALEITLMSDERVTSRPICRSEFEDLHVDLEELMERVMGITFGYVPELTCYLDWNNHHNVLVNETDLIRLDIDSGGNLGF